MDVDKGIIQNVKIYGDFFGWGEVVDIEEVLTGIRYEKAALEEALKEVDIQHYFGNIEKDDFLQLLY